MGSPDQMPFAAYTYSPRGRTFASISAVSPWPEFEEELSLWTVPHGVSNLGAADLMRLDRAILPFLPSGYAQQRKKIIGLPEFMVTSVEGAPPVILLGVLGKDGLGRLAEYMVANRVRYGVALDPDGISVCKRVGRSLFVHHMTQAPFTVLGFMLHLSLNDRSSPPTGDLVYDYIPEMRSVFEHGLSERVKNPQKLIAKLKRLRWSELEHHPVRLGVHERIRCYLVRTVYKGKPVVLKMRDLSKHFLDFSNTETDWKSCVRETVSEVDIYMRLGKKYQGKVVPNLLSFGMMDGGMFTYMMFPDERMGDILMESRCLNQVQHEVISNVGIAAVQALHARGLLYGREFAANDLVISLSEDCTAKLVGFSQVQVCQSATDRIFMAAATKETQSMLQVIDMLKPYERPYLDL